MALFDVLLGLDVNIVTDGEAAEEYGDTEDQNVKPDSICKHETSRTVARSIGSIANEEFVTKVILDTFYAITTDVL